MKIAEVENYNGLLTCILPILIRLRMEVEMCQQSLLTSAHTRDM